MKRFFSFIAIAVITLLAFANDDVVLYKGDLSFMQQSGEYAILEVDWSNTRVVEFGTHNKVKEDKGTIDEYNRSQGEDYVRDWPGVALNATSMACLKKIGFNKKNKKGVLLVIPEHSWNSLNSGFIDAKSRKRLEKTFIAVDPATARYKIIVHIDLIDMGNTGASVVFGGGLAKKTGGAKIMGYLDFIDRQTNEIVAQCTINDCRGDGQWSETARIQSVISCLMAERVYPLIKKSK